jgi:hypothetical protein
MTCPHCGKHIADKLVFAESGRLARKRRPADSPQPGRPRSDAPRCPCGASTLRRAEMRGFDCCKRAGVMGRVK